MKPLERSLCEVTEGAVRRNMADDLSGKKTGELLIDGSPALFKGASHIYKLKGGWYYVQNEGNGSSNQYSRE